MRKEHGGLGWVVFIAACLLTLAQAGCATSRGFGQDVQSLGHNIEKSAK